MTSVHRTGLMLLIKATFICLMFGLLNINTANAEVGFKCNKDEAPNSKGQCVTCGHKNQPACEPMRKGPQCFDYLEKVNGVCVARGGEGDLPYSGAGFDCKPGYNVENGRCTRCGGEDQMVCEAMRKGKHCNAGLDAHSGKCVAWGKQGKPPWPKIRPGFTCDEGLVASNNVCVPCGGLNQPMCDALRKGPRCRDYLAQIDGMCKGGYGGEGQPKYKNLGFDCKPGFNVNPDNKALCTACGGSNQPACEPMRKGKICNDGLTLSSLADKRCVYPPYHVADPFMVYNRSNREVFVSVHWILPDKKMWTMNSAKIAAGSSKAFPIAGKLTCYPNRHDQHDANVNPLSGLFKKETDSCLGQHFQVLFWDSQAKFAQWAAEKSLVNILTAIAYDQAAGKIAKGLVPIPGTEQAAELAGAIWDSIRDPNGTMAGWGVHDWAVNLPQQSAWVAYWGKGTKSDVVLDKASYVGNPQTIVPPSQRTPQPHVWFLLTTTAGELAQTNLRCDNMCPNPDYARSRVPASSTQSIATSTDVAGRGIGSVQGFNTLGLWDFEVNGKTLTDEFIEQTDSYVVLRRYGTTQNRRYEKVGENEYRNASGSTFRFVSIARGIWISADKQTVYQLKRR